MVGNGRIQFILILYKKLTRTISTKNICSTQRTYIFMVGNGRIQFIVITKNICRIQFIVITKNICSTQ